MPTLLLEDKLQMYTDRSGGDAACWPWTGARHGRGYGLTRYPQSQKKLGAHRAAWEVAHGPIPSGMYVCHTCDNPLCCNPSHLFLGTNADNQRDAVRKGRQVGPPRLRGEAVYGARLTDDAVRAMRSLNTQGTYSYRQLGERFGISKSQVGKILRGQFWAHVPEGAV